ncbi:DUF924 family protein [Aquicella lusitana]|uniref:Uncharacterized protein (DUF924 family) n=1 Tax=Aquicella lusitana TaxID=254246 RepID=A0A370GGC9_9COXI|nr:DUF924 family protein [Aquicella lusitana]RDI42721.1 uncharacterized protein (DUF924 family) [Aquicella lusitana]VVC73424.1 hypothetical protein AQULUS_11640 [Aquicella lusitana]
MTDKIHELLNFWFGTLGSADLPTSDRTNLWFGDSEVVRQQLLELFGKEFDAAISGKLNDWAKTPRGRLALIILLDQFPRYIYRHSPQAFAYDAEAQKLCIEGLHEKMDHSLTLIERVFFYMPLVHAESSESQEKSIRLYQDLVTLSMTETTQIYQLFLAYAYAHFRVIKEFGRFPQRNKVLGRDSTEAELAFLKNT